MDQIGKMVDEERKKIQTALTLDDDSLSSAWQAYLDDIPSPYIQQMLAQSSVRLSDDIINVTVGHRQVQDTMTKQYNWTRFVRQHFGRIDIQVEFIIEEDTSQEDRRRPVTNKEKLEYLVAKNDQLLELIQRFHLKFDS